MPFPSNPKPTNCAEKKHPNIFKSPNNHLKHIATAPLADTYKSPVLLGLLSTIGHDRLKDSVRIEETLRAVDTHDEYLTIALDVWPGYFPIWTSEKELLASGIRLRSVQNSARKYDLLLNGRVDLICTTPGCLCGQSLDTLRRCHLVGILNRSFGADQILVNTRKIRVDNGIIASPGQLHGCTALVTEKSTSHLFLLWYLIEQGIDPAVIDLIVTKDYCSTLDPVYDYGCADIVSTWEPWASTLRHQYPEFQPVYDSSSDPGVVYDIVVACRDRSTKLDQDPRLATFWKLFDDSLQKSLYLSEPAIRRMTSAYPISADEYHRTVGKVKFLDLHERRNYFSVHSKEDGLQQILDRVAQAWLSAGYGAMDRSAEEEFVSILHKIYLPAPHWMVAESQDPIARNDELPNVSTK